jgi:predicted neuraminidase
MNTGETLGYEHDGVQFAYSPAVIWERDERWTYAREPILRRMPDGSLLCIHYAGGPTEPHDENVALVTRSGDDGLTWSRPEILFDHPVRGVWVPELFTDAGDPCAFVHTMEASNHYCDLHTYRSWSRDGGKTWSEPASLPGGAAHVSVRQGIVLRDGAWLFPVYWQEVERGFAWTRGGGKSSGLDRVWRFRCGVLRSTDSGASFSLHGYIRHPDLSLWEPNVAELDDGSLVMLMRITGSESGAIWRSDSTDGGRSWSAPHPTDIPNPSTKLTVLTYHGAVILLNNPNPVVGERKPLALWVSRDGGATWPVRLVLADHPTGRGVYYPHGFVDPERRTLYLACDIKTRHYLLKIPMEDFLGTITP